MAGQGVGFLRVVLDPPPPYMLPQADGWGNKIPSG